QAQLSPCRLPVLDLSKSEALPADCRRDLHGLRGQRPMLDLRVRADSVPELKPQSSTTLQQTEDSPQFFSSYLRESSRLSASITLQRSAVSYGLSSRRWEIHQMLPNGSVIPPC